jgi:hypothetical protein
LLIITTYHFQHPPLFSVSSSQKLAVDASVQM